VQSQKKTPETEHGVAVKKIFRAVSLGLLGPLAPCIAGSAGAIVTPLVTRLSLAIRDDRHHSFSYCCFANLRNPTKFSENSNL